VPLDITGTRLRNQRLSGGRLTHPQEVVRWLGAVQAQVYGDAKWALGLRLQRSRDAQIEAAFSKGSILRTHVMRPTWHFVAPADIRWMLALTAPRVSAAMAPYNRRLELDASVFRRSENAMVRALRGGRQLTRRELRSVLERAGVRADGVQRLAHIVMQAELDAVICSGPRRGKQFTYALLDERVPMSRARSRADSLVELARRYFTSRGPAQMHDFVWWSGLTVADARAGLASVEGELAQDKVDGRTYWFSSSVRTLRSAPVAYLLPLYDEYLIAYKDRRAALDTSRWTHIPPPDPFSAPIVLNGQVVGGWKRLQSGSSISIALTLFAPLGKREVSAITAAARAYAVFLDVDLDLSWPEGV
jgi:Winged helix DNA-binding domain